MQNAKVLQSVMEVVDYESFQLGLPTLLLWLLKTQFGNLDQLDRWSRS